MNKLFITLLLTLGLGAFAHAAQNQNVNTQPMSEAKLKKMDHKLTKHKAVKRNFNTQKEFKRSQQRNVRNHNNKGTYNKSHRNNQDYNNGYNYNRDNYQVDYRHLRQRGYSRSNRGWTLAYRYDRASFYDNQGYFYGYFNRYGYYFQDVFYRYDRYYTYRDRVKGRGLFDHRYYMPSNASYYGFCKTRTYDDNRHERGYNRY